MYGLYVHIPFCIQKCSYCSFQVLPVNVIDTSTHSLDTLINAYVYSLCDEIKTRACDIASTTNTSFISGENFYAEPKKPFLKTIYFGGGTPLVVGVDNLITIIDTIAEVFSLEYLEELSLEMNPYPTKEVYECIALMQKKYKKFPRIRWSFGIQTFDQKVLDLSKRECSTPGLIEFLRGLVPYKQDMSVFNFDFIAFGFGQEYQGKRKKILWSDKVWSFFLSFVQSGFADSFSLYMLELQEGSDWFHNKDISGISKKKNTSHELQDSDYFCSPLVYEEFCLLKDVFINAGYQRYEVSNFAYPGKRSIHNMIYWTQGEWIGVGTSAVSQISLENKTIANKKDAFSGVFLQQNDGDRGCFDCRYIRWTNTSNIFSYIQKNWVEMKKVEYLTARDMAVEYVMLGLRLKEGIYIDESLGIDNVLHILENRKLVSPLLFVSNWREKIASWERQGLCTYVDGNLRLTDRGFDVINTILVQLLHDI